MSETPETTPATPPGSVCHIEIPAPDMAKITAFYAAAFGWELVPMSPGYTLFITPGRASSGGFDASRAVAEGGTVLVIAVDEVTAALGRIRAAGGTPVTEKMDIGGGHGFCAYFRDPCGNAMGVWSKG